MEHKIGIVGAGAIGAAHKQAIETNESCKLVAICDTVLEKAQILAQGTNAHVYTDYQQMQEEENLDAVILNLPHFLHKRVAVYFLEKGISVLVEKPMAITTEECDSMITASKKTGAKLAVGHVQKYFPCYRILKKMIEEKRFGKLCGIREVRNCDYFTGRPAWFLDRKLAGGGILMNFCAHTLDKIFYSTGLRVREVHAAGNNFLTDDTVEAIAQVLVKFDDGVNGTFCYCGCKVPFYYQTDFYFTNGAVRIKNGYDLWISEAGGEYLQVDNCDSFEIMDFQLNEFVKLLNNEASEVVSPEYGKEIVTVLEKALSQIA